ncbi:MAG TPA: hypothetical protein VGM25_09110 [Caulobacteraceae bacterium]|jgi:hypothetical protein
MGREYQFVIRGAIAAMAVSLAGAGASQAQPAKPPNPDPHDIQGTWMAAGRAHLTKDMKPHMGRGSVDDIPDSEITWAVGDVMPPFTAWGKAKFDANVQAQINNTPHADPSTNCMPHGLPRLMIAPYGVQIVQTKGMITLMHAVNHNVRYIHMDQKMPEKVPLTFNGYSVGHWEGDTLVVHSKGISSAGIIDQLGTPHSDELQTTERIRKIDGGKQLEDMMTFEDPKAYAHPWTARLIDNWDNGHRISEYVCEENNRNASNPDGTTTAR